MSIRNAVDIASNKSTGGTETYQHRTDDESWIPTKDEPQSKTTGSSRCQAEIEPRSAINDCGRADDRSYALDRYIKTPDPHEEIAVGRMRMAKNEDLK